MMPTCGQAARMNALAYDTDTGTLDSVSNWQRKQVVSCEQTGCVVAHWEHEDGAVYLAVRGSSNRKDLGEDVRVFLGHAPKGRIAFLESYIQAHCTTALEQQQLAVGGHSLGGMVAQGAAARLSLPGFIQNSPGWLVDPPHSASIAKVVEVRTSGDVIGAWGHAVPITLRVHDPEMDQWSFWALHNVHRQVALIEQQGWGNACLDDPSVRAAAPAMSPSAHRGVWGAVKAVLRQVASDKATNDYSTGENTTQGTRKPHTGL